MTKTALKRDMKFNVVQNDGDVSSVTVFLTGGDQPIATLVATPEHPNFKKIIAALAGNKPDPTAIESLFDVSTVIASKFAQANALHRHQLSERITIANGHLYLDHDEVHNAVVDAIVKFHEAGQEEFLPLLNFLEKLLQNPNKHSVEQLYRWLEKHRFALHPDGDIVAYKGVNKSASGVYMSSSSGTAFVNGIQIRGNIPNPIGAIVEMPRSDVVFNSAVACSTGLHVGNYRYAKGFAQHTLLVKVNPRDVVSVPTDSNDEKVRCCRYHVVGIVSSELKGALWAGATPTLRVDDTIHEQVKAAGAKIVDPAAVGEPKATTTRRSTRKQPAKTTAKQPVRGRAATKAKPVSLGKVPAAQVKGGLPKTYEEFTKANFAALTYNELRRLASLWELEHPTPANKDAYVALLDKKVRSVKRAAAKK